MMNLIRRLRFALLRFCGAVGANLVARALTTEAHWDATQECGAGTVREHRSWDSLLSRSGTNDNQGPALSRPAGDVRRWAA